MQNKPLVSGRGPRASEASESWSLNRGEGRVLLILIPKDWNKSMYLFTLIIVIIINTTVGSHFLLQGIFPTQGSNPGLQDCRRILYQLSQPGSLKKRYGEETNHQPKGITKIPLFNLETIKLKNM